MDPKVIKTEEEYEAALAHIGGLLSAELGTPQGDALELWTLLIQQYEEKAYPIGLPDPVSAIRFRMEQQKLKSADLVPFIGNKSKVSEVLNGKRPLSLSMIRRLHEGLGIPAEVLLQEPGAILPDAYKGVKWRSFPIAEIAKRGWIQGFQGTWQELRENAEELLGPLLFQDELRMAETALLRQHIRSGSRMNEYALWAWKARVLQLAKEEMAPAFEPGTVTMEFVRELVRLSRLNMGPRLAQESLQKSGIHLVFERSLRGTHLDGAVIWRSNGAPVIGMTLQHDRLDNFWFTLCHELAHVALHAGPNSCSFIDDLETVSKDKREKEADKWASNCLIPPERWRRRASKRPSETAVLRMASDLRVHPAIVAGRVRRETGNYGVLSHLIGQRQVRKIFEN